MTGAAALLMPPPSFAASRRLPPNPAFEFLNHYGQIINCPQKGRAVHSIDIGRDWEKLYPSRPVAGRQKDVFFSWHTGDDERGMGTLHRPYRTVKKALENTWHTAWGLSQTTDEILDVSEETTEGLPIRVKPFYRDSVVNFVGLNKTAWTVNGMERIGTPTAPRNLYALLWQRGGEYIAVSPAKKDKAGWWSQDAATKTIVIDSADTEDEPVLVYLPMANHQVRNANLFLEGINFVGSSQISVTDGAVFHALNCRFHFSNFNAIHTEGSFCATQGCDIYGSMSDGLNYNDDARGNPSTFLEVDNRVRFAGFRLSRAGDPEVRNHQSSSGHDKSVGIRIGGEYGEGNWGQGIADTGVTDAAGIGAKYWMVGCRIKRPSSDGIISDLTAASALYTQGDVWLDSCVGEGATYGMFYDWARIREHNCSWSGPIADVAGKNFYVADFDPTAA